jgi:hypothetical protein
MAAKSRDVSDGGIGLALELRDQPAIAFQELIAFLCEALVEFFELVDPASQARRQITRISRWKGQLPSGCPLL